MITIEKLLEKTKHIPSAVYEPEQKMWIRRLKDLPGKPVIVDFGTGHGKSTASLALACPQGHVYTFDTGEPYINNTCTPEEYDAETIMYILNSGADNFTFTRENSLTKEWDIPIDVLNIDSDHTYDTTKKELKKWIPFVKKDGLVFMHDWEHKMCPGVKKALDEYNNEFLIKERHEKLELVEITRGETNCICLKNI